VTSGAWWRAAAALGFAASAALHLATFTPLAARLGEGHVAAVFAGAFVPLVAMTARLRRLGAPARRWRGLGIRDWRPLVALVPGPARALVFATAMYVLMNLVLSLLLIGGEAAVATDGRLFLVRRGERREVTRAEYDAHGAAALRLASGHLLLFYLIPLVYFVFVDPRRDALVAAARLDTPGPSL